MRLETPPPLHAPARRRSIFVTVLGWALLAAGGLVSPVSIVSLLMLIAGSHGTASADLTGIVSVVVAPPFAVLTGVGLLRRWRWAWVAAVVLFVGVIAFNVRELATARPSTTTTTTSSGVKTTVMASGPNDHSLPLIALSLAVVSKLLTRSIRVELGVSGENRIDLAETPPPSLRALSPRLAATVASMATSAQAAATPRQRATAWLVVALLFGFAATMGWFVQRGLRENVTTLPISRASLQRPLGRATEPVAYWAALGVYSALGVAAGGAAFWLIRETRRAGAS